MTLLEIIVAIAISSIILMGMVRFLGTSIPAYRSLFLQSIADEAARVQLVRISHLMRSAKTSDTGAFPLVEASAQRVIFYANIDDDAATERVRYELNGTDLVRGVTKPSGDPIIYDTGQETVTTVARFIRNGISPVFLYYGSNYPQDTTQVPGTSLASIAYIAFSLTIDADTTNEPDAVTIQSQVQLRNLKTNL